MQNKPYVVYNHNSPEIQVVSDLISTEGGIPIFANLSVSEILDYKADTQYTNRQRIFQNYTATQEEKNQSVTDDLLPLNVGTELLVPKSKLATRGSELNLTQTFEPQDSTKFTNFVSSTLQSLLSDPLYKPAEKISGTSFTDFFPKITVFIWSRVLGELIDISPFIYVCNVNSEENGASFQITLPPILAAKSGNKWIIDRSSITDFSNGSSFIAQSQLFKNTALTKESDFYFHRIISVNDLVFIQYETLDIEKNKRLKDKNLSIDYSQIPNRIYDLIGMVDSSSITSNPSAGEIGINITGRDLSKALIDDGSVFYIQDFISTLEGGSALFVDRPENQKFLNRIYGKAINFNTLGYRSIDTHIRTVLNLYQSTGYVPNDIFRGYGNRRVSKEIVNDDASKTYRLNVEAQKNVAIDLIKVSRETYGLTLETGEDNAANSVFNDLLERIQSDTFADRNNVDATITQNSLTYFDGKLYDRSQLTSTSLSSFPAGDAISSVYSYNDISNQEPIDSTTTKYADGIWQIVDIEIDPSISQYRLADTSISEANGSILETMKSACDEPFMELFTDTYGDRFKIIGRRQPFNEKYYNELVEETVIDIDPQDVLSYNLQFNDSQAYSWYGLDPVNVFYGEKTNMKGWIPYVVLPEYVEIFGSKPYQKTTQYKPFVSKVDSDSKINLDIRQGILDLKYMIDINAYLPFSRTGTITISGDRRIKKKTAIRFTQTGEIFHVDAIQNSYTKGQGIDRTTTLQVSRGLVEKYMKGDTSYFNIVDTTYQEKQFIGDDTNSYDIVKNWKVNQEVFNFFLNRMQFFDKKGLSLQEIPALNLKIDGTKDIVGRIV